MSHFAIDAAPLPQGGVVGKGGMDATRSVYVQR